jgi:NADPH:quinone reductase-like Zn-dependent oxidoreductase
MQARGSMKAIVGTRYGPPDRFEFQDVAKPSVGADGVLVGVHAASVNPLDWHLMRGEPYFIRLMYGLRGPKRTVPGVDLAGEVEEVGAKVTQLRVGDHVYGTCDGAFAEFVCGEVDDFVPKPARLTFEQAAGVPVAGCTALQALRDRGGLETGQRVLINGAGGAWARLPYRSPMLWGQR